MSANTCNCTGVVGASGMGKSQFIKARLRSKHRGLTLVWSPLEISDRYALFIKGQAVSTIAGLVTAIKAKAPRLVYVPDQSPAARKLADQFDWFCRIAWECPGSRVLVEELGMVTSPSWAPPSWARLSTQGRHIGIELIGSAQFPAMIDKKFLGNCTELRTYRLNEEAHARVVAAKLRMPWERLLDLPKLHYIHRNIEAAKNVAGIQKIITA